MRMKIEEAHALVRQSENLSVEEIGRLQTERLRNLVEYARRHSDLFAGLYAQLKEPYTLQELPVTDKAFLMAHADGWFTDKELNLAVIRRFLAENTDPCRKLLDRYSVLTTSGTSGDPMPMVRDESHDSIHAALLNQRLLKEVGAQILNPSEHKIACVIFTNGKVSSYSSFLKMKKAANVSDDRAIAVSILDPIPTIVSRLNDFQPDVLTGYPSVLADLACEQLNGNLRIHPKMIACSAERMTSEHYRIMREVYGCPVLNNYCSTEGGEIAMSCPEGHLHLNIDWVIVEPIDTKGNPVPEGELSDAVLLTDLSNFVQPIIRYKVNDHVRLDYSPCPCGCKLPRIEIFGRKGGTLELCGKALNTLPISAILAEEKEVVNFQFVQTAEDTLEFRSVIPLLSERDGSIRKRICDRVTRHLEQNGYPKAKVIASDLPVIKKSSGGKSECFISLAEYRKL